MPGPLRSELVFNVASLPPDECESDMSGMTDVDNAVELKVARGQPYPGDKQAAARMVERTIDFLSEEAHEQVDESGVGMDVNTPGLPTYTGETNVIYSWAYKERKRGARCKVVTTAMTGRLGNWVCIVFLLVALVILVILALGRH